MLQYLILQLCDTSVSYCHYGISHKDVRLMPLSVLEQAVLWAMKENLSVQVVYPDYEIPREYKEVIDRVDHTDIVSSRSNLKDTADVVVISDWDELQGFCFRKETAYVLRTTLEKFYHRYEELKPVLEAVSRLNVVFLDVAQFADADIEKYRKALTFLTKEVESIYAQGGQVQLNLLTDRMMLDKMNNCGAGETNVTLAPDGKFYVCPAFYNESNGFNVGNMQHGLDVKNAQLYKLDHAPICRHCDAYHCKRCVWMNRETTLEVNTPSHEQCVMAHLERNASRQLLEAIRKHGTFLPEQKAITEIDYLDPFEKRKEWQ